MHIDHVSNPGAFDGDDRLEADDCHPNQTGATPSARRSRRAILGLGLGAAAAALAALATEVAQPRAQQSHHERTGRHHPLASASNSVPAGSSTPLSRSQRAKAGQPLHPTPSQQWSPGSTAVPGSSGPSTTPLVPASSPPSGTQSPVQGPAPGSALRYFAPAANQSLYLTIDDGWYPSTKVLDLMGAEHLPLTTFLIAQAAENTPEHVAYWRAFVEAGGVIQNHTVSHPWLTTLPAGEIEAQWAGASSTFEQLFGFRPTLGRPPYGAVDDAVWQAAANCGIEELVMWSAVDNGRGIQTWNQGPLAPGMIVLMHWDPGLYDNLRQVLTACEAQGLVPRPLPTASWAAAAT